MHFEFLVESQVDRTALEPLLNKILGNYNQPHTWVIHKHACKGKLPVDSFAEPKPEDRSLLHNLPSKLRAYGKVYDQNIVVIVLVDLDADDCHQLKVSLLSLLEHCIPKPKVLFRIAIEELESWFLGDEAALFEAFPNADHEKYDHYQQDSICNTWETLAEIIDSEIFNRIPNKRSQLFGKIKREWASEISKRMRIEANRSHSFCVFRDGLRKIILNSISKEKSMKPWKLLDVKYSHVKETSYEVAVLPLGATEPHNLHLPYGTDTITIERIGEILCEAAHLQGAKVILLPCIPIGVDNNLLNFPLTLSLNPSTLDLVITDIVASLECHGIRKLVLLNGHGGNSLKHTLRELHDKTDVFISLIDWYAAIKDVYHEFFENPDDHAGEMETSLALYLFPELVDVSMADDGAVKPSRFDAVNRGWVQVTRPWELVTRNSGVGDPRKATAEKGKQIIDVLKERFVPYLKALSEVDLDQNFLYVDNE